MPKWLVKQTLRELEKIDNLKEKGKITQKQHDERSKKAIEKALAIEENIYGYSLHNTIIGKFK
jgi:hypothetical protein